MTQMMMDLQSSQDETLNGPEIAPTVPVTDIKPRMAVNRSGNAGSSSKVSHAGQRAPDTKTEIVLKKLRLARGATIPMLMEATAWQAHSVRGFLSGTVKKKLGLTVTSEVGKDGQRRYRIDDSGKAV